MEWGTFRAMGSAITWRAATDLGPDLVAWFEEVEECCSRFRQHSELSALNRRKDEAVEVSELLGRVLAAADRAFELSEGLVDPTILDDLERAGYDRDFDLIERRGPDHMTWKSPGGRWKTVRLDGDRMSRPAGTRIDLGGIAKSWTVQEGLELADGPLLIDAGGDIATRGLWSIRVQHANEIVASVVVEDGGVATSGIDRRRWAGGHHIIDPRAGEPAITDVVAATVVASDAPIAETIARSIVLRGMWDGLGWAESLPQVRGALVTTIEGSTVALPITKEVIR